MDNLLISAHFVVDKKLRNILILLIYLVGKINIKIIEHETKLIKFLSQNDLHCLIKVATFKALKRNAWESWPTELENDSVLENVDRLFFE